MSKNRRLLKRRVWLAVAGLVAATLISTLLWVLPRSLRRASVPHAIVASTSNQSVDAVTDALNRLHLAGRLHVTVDDHGLPTVAGWVHDTAERDMLANALAQLAPMPGMQVLIETDAVNSAQVLAAGFGEYIDAQYQGDGRIRLAGIIDSEAARAKLRRAFTEQLPGATLDDMYLIDRTQMAQALRQTLHAAGLGRTEVAWTAAGLEANAPAGTNGERLYELLQRFKDRYGKQLPLLARVGQQDALIRPSVLPFQILSITSGALPTVVVSGGVRLLPGGSYRGYRLVGVTDTQVVFDGISRITLNR